MIIKADVFVRIATQGLVGFSIAPGTVATVLMVPIIYFLGCVHMSMHYYLLFILLLFFSAGFIISRALPAFDHSDPSAIVLDEMVAFPFVFLMVPITPLYILLGFFLFRFFDIAKPCGINVCEQLPGVFGVMLDDVMAAFFSSIFLYGMYSAGF